MCSELSVSRLVSRLQQSQTHVGCALSVPPVDKVLVDCVIDWLCWLHSFMQRPVHSSFGQVKTNEDG